MSKQITIQRPCPGCANVLVYTVVDDNDYDAPSFYMPLATGGVAYKGGHICGACADFIDRQLETRRRKEIGSKFVFVYANGSRRAVVSDVESARAIWMAYLDRTGHGASEAGNGGRMLDAKGKQVARISYNGAVYYETAPFTPSARS